MLVIQLKKTDYNTKVPEIETKINNNDHNKYITTPEFNTLAVVVFNASLSRVNLVVKANFDNTVSSLNSKIAENKTKNGSIENELKKLKTFDLGYFIGKSHLKKMVYTKLFTILTNEQIFQIDYQYIIYFIMAI